MPYERGVEFLAMSTFISSCLFKKDSKAFEEIKKEAKAFSASYNGDNIIQDDIFHIIGNYAKQQSEQSEIIFLPVQDEDFYAFSCSRGGVVFVAINSSLSVAQQIFAAAHELYHVKRYFEGLNDDFLQTGSILLAGAGLDDATKKEDCEANAFAGALLVPDKDLIEQIGIFGIEKKHLQLDDILVLMEIFAIPYKAMVLRLFEEGYVSEKKAEEFLLVDGMAIQKRARLKNMAERWLKHTYDIKLSNLEAIIDYNQAEEIVPENRIKDDRRNLAELLKGFSIGAEKIDRKN